MRLAAFFTDFFLAAFLAAFFFAIASLTSFLNPIRTATGAPDAQ